MIENEKNPDFSWAANAFADGLFDEENYEIDYRFGKEYMYWFVSKRNDGNFYSAITLKKEQVK